jgi:hypothetical protein
MQNSKTKLQNTGIQAIEVRLEFGEQRKELKKAMDVRKSSTKSFTPAPRCVDDRKEQKRPRLSCGGMRLVRDTHRPTTAA